RAIEALRMYAAEHGKWPQRLEDVTEAPVPEDPFTAKPFQYSPEKRCACYLHRRTAGRRPEPEPSGPNLCCGEKGSQDSEGPIGNQQPPVQRSPRRGRAACILGLVDGTANLCPTGRVSRIVKVAASYDWLPDGAAISRISGVDSGLRYK